MFYLHGPFQGNKRSDPERLVEDETYNSQPPKVTRALLFLFSLIPSVAHAKNSVPRSKTA
jgi:hypothetical protein